LFPTLFIYFRRHIGVRPKNGEVKPWSSLPQKPTADLKSVKSLLEKHNPREAYEILAAQIILANQRTPDAPPSRVHTESRKIKIAEKDLQEIRTGRFGRLQLPTEKEARYWLQQWRESAKPKEETPVRRIVIRRNRNEVRE